jgi:Asp/Glu/hydantoin racemase
MPQTLAMIHTVGGLMPLFAGLCDELLPGVKRFNIADEGLLRMALAAGDLTPAIYRRLCEDVVWAVEAGADAILVTCSTISPCVDVAQKMVSAPVLKIDEPMADKAVGSGSRIAVVATVPTALKATSDLVRERAAIAGKSVQVQAVLCTGAFDALSANDPQRHDRIVADYLRRVMLGSDVVVLAQASMARVADALPAQEKTIPILSSPRLGVERARAVLERVS